jgi:hypothetical protein|tara:strand:- start:764 stop:1729 length:966 start_codon:yes stop_codon:yes gene_type:complete
MTAITKDFRLNADKRKSIENVYENFLLTQTNKVRKTYDEAKAKFDELYPKVWELATQVVRNHQPQCDVDTINSMRDKYGDNGGRIHDDNCFYFINPSMETNDRGEQYENENEIHVDMTLNARPTGTYGSQFAYAYYYDELKQKGLDPDFDLRWSNERRNPRYYETESQVRQYLGFSRTQNDDRKTTHKSEWEAKTIPVIGTSYCHSRQFKVDDVTHSVFNEFNIAQEKLCQAHESMFNYVNEKVMKLRQGLRTYTKFSQAKQLFDKLGIPLNDTVIDEQSSMALSVFSPDNLADMLTDQEEQFSSREEKIAYFKSLQAQAN